MKFNYLFGPVPSRRLGASLGVDLVPFKVCSLNCIYCETGRTNNLTSERKEYIDYKDLIYELDQVLSATPEIDYITFSGAGEPTLNSRIGDVINFIKNNYPFYKIALITNGTLLHNRDIREEISKVDLILPSLDAATPEAFTKINRGCKSFDINKIIDGIADFQSEYNKEMWLEIFLVPGINDSENEINSLVEAVKKINPTRVQLNTLDRPGVEDWVQPLTKEKMEEIAEKFKPFETEVIAKFSYKPANTENSLNLEESILGIISRRPCTLEDLVEMTKSDKNKVNQSLNELIEKNKLESVKKERGIFYQVPGSR